MPTIVADRPSAEKADPIDVCPGQRKSAPKSKIGYDDFDAVPRSLRRLVEEHSKLPPPPADMDPRQRRAIMNDRLRTLDILVLMDLLKYRRMTCSCWRAKAAAARDLGQSERTIQYSWRRLALHGFIEQVQVANPDPDDPGNETGYRFTLLFAAGAERQGKGPDRRPPSERKGSPREHSVASPLLISPQPVASPPEHSVASKQCVRDSYPSGEKQELEKTPPSSSSERDDDGEKVLIEGGESKRIAIEAVRKHLGEDAAAIVEDDAEAIAEAVSKDRPPGQDPWELVEHAAYMAIGNPNPIRKAKSWLVFVATGFPPAGPSAEARIARKNALARTEAKPSRINDYDAIIDEMIRQNPEPELPVSERIQRLEAEIEERKAAIERDEASGVYTGLLKAGLKKLVNDLAALEREAANA